MSIAEVADLPTIRAELQKRHKDIIAERKAHVTALRQLERDADTRFPALQKAVDEAAARVRQAEEVVAAARAAAIQAVSAQMSASFSYDHERSRLESLLADGASPAIAAFRSEMLDELAATRRAFHAWGYEVRNPVTGAATTGVESNAKSLAARSLAISAAMDAAETLKLEPDQSIVPSRLAELRAAIPAIEP